MRVKICDVYNTKYFYVTMGRDLSYMWNTCLTLRSSPNADYNVGNAQLGTIYDCFKTGAPVEFDLAGARLTSDVTRIVIDFIRRGIVMCDTESSWRDNILKENYKRLHTELTTVPLPTYTWDMSAKDYIQSLQTDVIYQPPSVNPEVYIPLLVMITMTRPKVQICLNSVGIALFNFVANKLPYDVLSKYSEYYMITREGIQIVNKDNIYVQNLGKVTLDEALTSANFIPTIFGNERLNNDPDFKGIFMECLKMVNRYRSTRKPLLSDILN